MRFILLLMSLFIATAINAQGAMTCKYKTEITDSNYVIIWRKCKGFKYEIDSEGPVRYDSIMNTSDSNFIRHGTWKKYDLTEPGKVYAIEYWHGFILGQYRQSLSDGSSIEYNYVKTGISTITYYNKRNKITKIESFDLNDPEKTTEKIFYDINGNEIRKEIWKNGVKVS